MRINIIFIAISMLILLSGSLESKNSQDSKDTIINRRSSGGDSTAVRKAIPNWKVKPTRNAKDKILITNADKAVQTLGSANIDNNIYFIDNSNVQGYPQGWSTNSSTPILKYSNSGNKYIELPESDNNLQLLRIIELEHDYYKNIKLEYTTTSSCTLLVKYLSNNNQSIAEPTMAYLESGKDIKISIKLEEAANATRILIIFIKPPGAEFKLTDFSLEQWEISNAE